jgi:phage replication-related protein YjqB (UPF0714/DUF867 family)
MSINAINLTSRPGRGRVWTALIMTTFAVVIGASSSHADEFDCFSAANCTNALESSTTCLEPQDYTTTTSDAGSDVTVLSFHGGNIETSTSTISLELASRYGWNRYDFNGHGTSTCLDGLNNHQRLHITATHFDDRDAIDLVAAHPHSVAIHGYSTTRGYTTGTLCVGGASASQRLAFINHVNNHKAAFESSAAGYPITPVDAPLVADPNDCHDLDGTHANNLVNRNANHAGLQLELHKDLRAHLADVCNADYEPLRELIFAATAVAMGHNPNNGN